MLRIKETKDILCANMKRLAFLLLLIFPNLLVGQHQSAIDSLNHILSGNIADTIRINALLDLAGEYYLSEPLLSINYCETALGISEKIKDEKKTTTCLGWLAFLFEQQGEIDKAIKFNLQALSLAKKNGMTEKKSDTAQQSCRYIQRQWKLG